MNHLKLTHDKLEIDSLTNLAIAPQCGAVSLFVGTTRDNFEDRTVVCLEYEAYESMALKALEGICKDIRERWKDVENIVIYHRLGDVPVKEASIVIAISSPHRADSMQATNWCIDYVKKSVPIWKKEIYASAADKPQWKENKESPKFKRFKTDLVPEIEVPFVSPHLIQIKASNQTLNERIQHFMERKRNEINANNIREFCKPDRDLEFQCARVDAVLHKQKDSKGHLPVSKILNTYHRDQTNLFYLSKYIPKNGVEERVQNLELQLNLTTPVPQDIYRRLKNLEDRMLYLESISPEYLNFWDKTSVPNKVSNKKRVFEISEIDSIIAELEQKVDGDKKTTS